MATAKVQCLRQLVKLDVTPTSTALTHHQCQNCSRDIDDVVLEQMQDLGIEDTQLLLESTDTLRDKVIYIAGFLTHKFAESVTLNNEEDEISIPSTFVQELNRGGLSLPSLSTAFFVHAAVYIEKYLSPSQHNCRSYFARALSYIDASISENYQACVTMTNILMKAHVNDNSDRQKENGCLRRREKLQ